MTSDGMRWQIGAVSVTRVEERITPVPWKGLIPGGDNLVEGLRPWIDPFVSSSGSHILLSVHSFVVETPQTVLVVDTCVGLDTDLSLTGDPTFEGRLAEALPSGIASVDIVVCTHLHFDHVGWNTVERNGVRVPTFPNATYLVTEAELAAERDEEDTAAYRASIEPLERAGCLQPVSGDHRIDDFVTLEPTPGHTPGHVSLRIASNDASALITGDFVHSPLQLAHPEVSSRPDADPDRAIATRRRMIADLADTDTLVLGTHFAPPTAGHVTRNVDGDVEFRRGE